MAFFPENKITTLKISCKIFTFLDNTFCLENCAHIIEILT